MSLVVAPPEKHFSIDALIQSIEGDVGMFFVLFGLERNGTEITEYHIGIFDSSFRGGFTKPEHLIRATRHNDFPLYAQSQFHWCRFNYTNACAYVTFELDPFITPDNFPERFKQYLRECLEHLKFSQERIQQTLEKIFPNVEPPDQYRIEQIPQKFTQARLMPYLRVEHQLAQRQVSRAELSEMHKDLERRFFNIVQFLFSSEDLNSYQPTNRDLVLPEHRKFPFIRLYTGLLDALSSEE